MRNFDIKYNLNFFLNPKIINKISNKVLNHKKGKNLQIVIKILQKIKSFIKILKNFKNPLENKARKEKF